MCASCTAMCGRCKQGFGDFPCYLTFEQVRFRGRGCLFRISFHRICLSAMSSEMSEKLLIGCVAENDEKYLSQALRLVRSLRWFGGLLGAADFVVCAVEGIERAYRDELENLGAAIRIVPRFDQTNPLFNKIQLFRLPDVGRYETLLYLDCDTIIARDPSPYLSNLALRIKMADVPTVSTEALERVCGYFGLRPPERRYRTTQDQTPTIWYCNAGVISCPVRFIPRLIPAWCEFE